MQKSILLALILVFLSFGQAIAEETRRMEVQKITREIKETRQETRSNVAELHSKRLTQRFGFYATRLSGIIRRFEARLDVLKEGGKDTSTVQAKLDEAKTKLDEAIAKGKEAVAAFDAIDPARFSEQRAEAFAGRDLATEARKLFQEVHTLLKEAIRLLKAL